MPQTSPASPGASAPRGAEHGFASPEWLLRVVHEATREARPGANQRVTLDSSLERELGLDSLGRAQLLQRLEQDFRCRLPDDLLTRAKTPRDLLTALRSAEALTTNRSPRAILPPIGAAEEVPASARSFVEVLAWHASVHADRPHVVISQEDRVDRVLTYGELHQRAREIGAWIVEHDREPGQRVAIMLPTCADFYFAFFGVLYAGCIPVPVYPPLRLAQLEDHLRRQAGVLRSAGATTENGVGLSFPAPGRAPRIDHIDRVALAQRQVAEPVAHDCERALDVVACGRPLPGHEIRIVDGTGREVAERHEGRLQFRGPSTTAGYFENPQKTRELFEGDWANSGDLAYIADGEVFITGRRKDLIIRGGRNIHPEDIETAVSELPGIRKGCVVALAAPDPRSGSERLVVVAETRLTAPTELASLRARVAAVTDDLAELPAEEVLLVPPHSIPKTSSGKLRRAAARELYEAGSLGARPAPVAWQLVRLGLGTARGVLRRGVHTLAALAYAAHWWAGLAVVAILLWPAVVLMPRSSWRWRVFRRVARAFFRVTATPVTVRHLERLPAGSFLIVANHASYVDGLVLPAALPRELRFVAKQELASQFFAGVFLRRLGTEFVERHAADQAVRDAARLARLTMRDAPLVFFPEGTLTRRPGLAAFHMGAFVAAAESGLAVVPVAMRGTRSLLRDGQWLPRRAPLEIVIGEPIHPEGHDWPAAARLRDAARRALLALTGEPDLAADRE